MLKLIALIGVLALAAAATRPTEAAIEARIGAELHAEIQRGEIDLQRNAGQAVLLAACKAKPDICVDLARELMEVRYDDYRLFAVIGIQGLGKQTRCFGAFTAIVCPGGLRDQR